nr:hypothetical protein [Tanacetum cinerariifolium]
SSLVRIMRNGFNHHEEMSEGVKKAVGETKQRWNAIFIRRSSLVRIMRNGFNHHKEMSEGVKKAVGETKQRWNAIFVPMTGLWSLIKDLEIAGVD